MASGVEHPIRGMLNMVAKPADKRALDELMQIFVKTLTGKTTADTKDDTESRSDAEATAEAKTTAKTTVETKDSPETQKRQQRVENAEPHEAQNENIEIKKRCSEAGSSSLGHDKADDDQRRLERARRFGANSLAESAPMGDGSDADLHDKDAWITIRIPRSWVSEDGERRDRRDRDGWRKGTRRRDGGEDSDEGGGEADDSDNGWRQDPEGEAGSETGEDEEAQETSIEAAGDRTPDDEATKAAGDEATGDDAHGDHGSMGAARSVSGSTTLHG